MSGDSSISRFANQAALEKLKCCYIYILLPISGDHKQKFYWGHKEILLPVYKNMADAMKKHSDVDVLISFASLRSAFDSTMEVMQYPQVERCTIKYVSHISPIHHCINLRFNQT